MFQGFVNSSYQRDGFGLLQTDDFDTYLGFFRYNRLHGPGLLLYRDGSLLYGSFRQGDLSGVGLTDNAHQLQLGLFTPRGMMGIGFEYNHQRRSWKMNRYHKGVSIETLNEETRDLEEGPPSMLSLEPAILKHFLQFKTNSLFDPQSPAAASCKDLVEDLNDFYLYDLGTCQFYGATIEGKHEGLGVLYDKQSKSLLEAGFYRDGVLDGYGLKIEKGSLREELGHYSHGRRDGLFYERYEGKAKIVLYSKGACDEKKGASLADISTSA
jgi:hypothetical protein